MARLPTKKYTALVVLLLLMAKIGPSSATCLAPRCCDDSDCGSALRCTDVPEGVVCNKNTTCVDGVSGFCTLDIPEWSCFPDYVKVQVEKREEAVSMKNLRVGDRVLVRGDSYETVYGFGHYDTSDSTFQAYLEISAKLLDHKGADSSDSDDEILTSSYDHLIEVVGKGFIAASAIESGDILLHGTGSALAKVTRIRPIVRTAGLYAPLTPSGTLLVNNVSASCYVSFFESTEENDGGLLPFISRNSHWISHIALSPYRLACLSKLGMCQPALGTTRGDGRPWFTKLGMKSISLLRWQPSVIQGLLIAIFFLIFGTLWLIEFMAASFLGSACFCGFSVLVVFLIWRVHVK